jgi:hypothetical protein
MSQCSTLYVHCIDHRFQRHYNKLAVDLGIEDDFDRLSVKGGAGNFGQLQEHLEAAQQLHGATVAILTVHEECGAGAKREDLFRAAEMARNCGYEIIRSFFVRLDGTCEEVKEASV